MWGRAIQRGGRFFSGERMLGKIHVKRWMIFMRPNFQFRWEIIMLRHRLGVWLVELTVYKSIISASKQKPDDRYFFWRLKWKNLYLCMLMVLWFSNTSSSVQDHVHGVTEKGPNKYFRESNHPGESLWLHSIHKKHWSYTDMYIHGGPWSVFTQ